MKPSIQNSIRQLQQLPQRPKVIVACESQIIDYSTICWLVAQTQYRTAKLIYSGARDGWSAKEFHDKCDKKGATVTVMMNINRNIYGGYTQTSWGTHRYNKSKNAAFIFSIKSPTSEIFKIFRVKKNAIFVTYDQSVLGPCFGHYDLYITDNCHTSSDSTTFLGESYHNDTNDEYYLTGHKHFRVQELEVFALE
jgi:hypothetical protein